MARMLIISTFTQFNRWVFRYSVESPTILDYARSAHLNEKQLANLNSLIEGVIQRKEMQLVLLGMPLGAWSELYYLFNRIIVSGFVGNLDEDAE